MIAETTTIYAHFRQTTGHAAHRARVIAWDDEGHAMIATRRGRLQRACEVEGFTELDTTDDGDDIIQLIPANGERIAYTNPEERDPTVPVVAWGLTRDGALLVRAVIDHATACGCERIRLEIIVPNTAAERLYTRQGFRRTGIRGIVAPDDPRPEFEMACLLGEPAPAVDECSGNRRSLHRPTNSRQ